MEDPTLTNRSSEDAPLDLTDPPPSSSRGAGNSGALQREVKEEDEEGQGHVNMATWEGQKWKSGEVGAQALACLVLREMEIRERK